MNLSKRNQAVKDAYILGYRVINNEIYNPKGKILKGSYSKSKKYKQIYRTLGVPGHSVQAPMHQLVAFQKYGNQIFERGIVVRHLDGDTLNNYEDNISIGTQQQNILDRDPIERKKHAIKASSQKRKFTNKDIDKIRRDYLATRSYKLVMEKWNISSKGTLYYILNNNYITTK